MVTIEKIPPSLKKKEKIIVKPALSITLFPIPGISISFAPLGEAEPKNKKVLKELTSEKNLPYLFLLFLGLAVLLGGKK